MQSQTEMTDRRMRWPGGWIRIRAVCGKAQWNASFREAGTFDIVHSPFWGKGVPGNGLPLWQKKRDSCIMINDYKMAYLYAFNYISYDSKKKARTKWQL
jgi:hypothetical protein